MTDRPDPEPDPDDPPPPPPPPSYRDRIAILPGHPRIAYRPSRVLVQGRDGQRRLAELLDVDDDARDARIPSLFDRLIDPEREDQVTDAERTEPLTDEERTHPLLAELRQTHNLDDWFVADDIDDPPAIVDILRREGLVAELDVVYFANHGCCCGVCPPHPAIATAWAANPYAANPYAANPYAANPYAANPYAANPYAANPYAANPYAANAESLNVAATGKPPTSSVLPARQRAITQRPPVARANIVVGVLDSGLAGGPHDDDGLRPNELGPAAQAPGRSRISGGSDMPSADGDLYLDPVAGHGTFIAGIIEQLTPGCTIQVSKVLQPEGDVSSQELFFALIVLVIRRDPTIVNFSFAGASTGTTLFEQLIRVLYALTDIVFVGSAGNEGTCVEQYPAALPEVIGVAALGPEGPAPWSNYGPWVDACAPGTDLVSAFFAGFDGALPPINGVDADNFEQWATWSGTSFAAPVVVAALARETPTTPGASARPAVERVIRAAHLARLPNMGTIVND